MDTTETHGDGAAGAWAVHDIAAIVEVLLDEAIRADEGFLAYLLELTLHEAAAVAARMPGTGAPLRPDAEPARAGDGTAPPAAEAHH